MLSARQSYAADVEFYSQSVTGVTVTGVQWVADLGGEAAAAFENRSGTDGVELLVRSGNAELNY